MVIGAAAAVMLLLVGGRGVPIALSLAAVAAPPVAWIALARGERAGRRSDPRLVFALIGLLLIAAVLIPPQGSKDLWSYTMYGRMISQHWSSPYTHVPSDFPHDPFLHQVARGWRHTPSVYGPVFVAVAAVGSAFAGNSLFLARLFEQGLAAVAVVAALAVVWRRTRSTAAVALLGLNPVIVISVVNGGHNDALVGLGILLATLLVTTRRLALGGLALGVAALIKITALLAFPALAAWAAWRLGRHAAVRFGAVLALTVGLGYAAAGPGAFAALSGNRRLMSRASPWQIPRALLGIGTGHPMWGISGSTWIGGLTTAAVGTVCILVVAITWWRRRDAEPIPSVVLALTAFLVLGAYVLPWYVAWMLPVACVSLHRSSRWLAMLLSGFLTAVYIVKAHALPHAVDTEWQWLGSYIGPIVIVLWCVLIALDSRSRPARTSSESREPLQELRLDLGEERG